jgi:hypothetical protein
VAKKKKPGGAGRKPEGVEVVEAEDLYDNLQPIGEQDMAAIRELNTLEDVQEYLWQFAHGHAEGIPERRIKIRDRATGKTLLGIASVQSLVRWEECDDDGAGG